MSDNTAKPASVPLTEAFKIYDENRIPERKSNPIERQIALEILGDVDINSFTEDDMKKLSDDLHARADAGEIKQETAKKVLHRFRSVHHAAIELLKGSSLSPVVSNKPAIAAFLVELADTEEAFLSKDYGRNGRIGSLIQDITDPDEAEIMPRYYIQWHDRSVIDCHGDEDVLDSLNELRNRVENNPETQFMISEEFYSNWVKEIDIQIARGEVLSEPVQNAYNAARQVRHFSNSPEKSYGSDVDVQTRVEAVEKADTLYRLAHDDNGNPLK
jgi:hypothetical protein